MSGASEPVIDMLEIVLEANTVIHLNIQQYNFVQFLCQNPGKLHTYPSNVWPRFSTVWPTLQCR